MKISVIGAGNVGGTTAMRLAEEGVGEIVLVDVAKGLAQGKAFDLEDARPVLKRDYSLAGTDDYSLIKDSEIVVVTAGLARKPGMTREDLLQKNASILKDVCLHVKSLAPQSILIIVTNPLDLMTRYAQKITGFKPNRVFGMGVSLDAARLANLISKELNVPASDVDAFVMGVHGEGMLPMPRFTKIKGVLLEEFLSEEKIAVLLQRTVDRGKEIVSLLGSGSAYYAPSAAVTSIVKAIVKDEKRTIGICASLNGEYGLKDIYIGVPCRLGKNGVEEIVRFDLNAKELETLHKSAVSLAEQFKLLAV